MPRATESLRVSPAANQQLLRLQAREDRTVLVQREKHSTGDREEPEPSIRCFPIVRQQRTPAELVRVGNLQPLFMSPHTSHYSSIRMHVSRQFPRDTSKSVSAPNSLRRQTLESFSPTLRRASTRCRVSRSSHAEIRIRLIPSHLPATRDAGGFRLAVAPFCAWCGSAQDRPRKTIRRRTIARSIGTPVAPIQPLR